MAMGWGSSLMQNEATFMVFDGALLMLACGTLTMFHPAIWFKFMSKKLKKGTKQDSDIEMSVTRVPEQSAAHSTTKVGSGDQTQSS